VSFPDAVELCDFYQTPLGRTTRRLIHRKIRGFWPDLRGRSLLGIGYTMPYLQSLQEECSEVCAVMPAQQGVLPWPENGPGKTVLALADELPFADCSFDRILLVHGLEACGENMLAEAWRVLAGNGRLLLVVPSRRGVWARTERTPFGYGYPFSSMQLSRALRDNNFTPEETTRCLYFPPIQSEMLLAAAPALERIGENWFGGFGGVAMVEASKQVYALPKPRGVSLRRRLLQMPLVLSPSGS
jgi:SAM-dependent methyltransferase